MEVTNKNMINMIAPSRQVLYLEIESVDLLITNAKKIVKAYFDAILAAMTQQAQHEEEGQLENNKDNDKEDHEEGEFGLENKPNGLESKQ